MAKQISEQMRFGDIKPNSAFYLVDPNTVQAPLFAEPHYTCEALDPDTTIWVVYEAGTRSGNPYAKKG